MLELAEPYDDEYAASYNERWSRNEAFRPEFEHNMATLRALISPQTAWLDAGCGTGVFLSQFPGIKRAGFDRSAAMLTEASKANSSDVLLRQLDLRERADDWVEKWSLVSATGQPWTYLPTMQDIHLAIDNLAAYTAASGTCMISFYDLSDFTSHQLKTHYSEEELGNSFYVSGIVWNHREDGYLHRHMLLPNADQWIRWLSHHFLHIEVRPWPVVGLRISRRVLICSQKRPLGDQSSTQVIEQPTGRWQDRPLSYFLQRFRPIRPGFWLAVMARLFQRIFKKDQTIKRIVPFQRPGSP